jgi:nicotinamidase/pyrazinamidase
MKTVFLDVDSQIDFLYPAGALYVPSAETLVPVIARINRHAVDAGLTLISTADAHGENDPEFRDWPAHCVKGTVGQLKPNATMVGGSQVIFEKVTTNCFADSRLDKLLEQFGAERFVVYGVVTEICVRFAAIGLLDRGKEVQLVTDAVMHLDPNKRDAFIDDFRERGGTLTTSAQVLGS